MPLLLSGAVEPVALTERDIPLAQATGKTLAGFVNGDDEPVALLLTRRATGQQMEADIPASVLRLLSQALSQMAAGNPVTLTPLKAELSTQQAADRMGVSRPYVVKLLETGKLPYRKVGEQRRIRYVHLLAYLERERVEANKALDELVALSEEMGLYEMDYPRVKKAKPRAATRAAASIK